MNILPLYDEAIIPLEKFIDYALNPNRQPHKALAFELALGYNIENVDKLIKNIKSSLNRFPAKAKGNKGFGELYEVILVLKGENGKTARVLTGWIDDAISGELRLTSVYVDKWKR